MAVLQDDENMKQSGQGAQPGQPGQPAAAGGAGGGFVGSGGGQGATTAKAAPAAPTSGPAGNFTNLQSYLQANQGQDTRMGQDVAGTVNAAGKASSDANATWQDNGLADMSKGTARLDQGFMDKVKAGSESVDPTKMAAITGGVTNNVYSGPTDAGAGYTGPTAAPSASYTGLTDPTKVSGYDAAQSAYSGLQGVLGQANGGSPGVSALLKSTYGRPSYTAGENTLDTALTTGGSGWQGTLKSINDAYKTPAFQDTSDVIKAAQQSGQATSQNIGNMYTAAINDAQGTSTAAKNAYADAIKAAQQKAASWTNPGVFAAPAPVALGTSSASATAALPNGTTPDSQGQNGGKSAGVPGGENQDPIVAAAKATSPGQVNHAVAGAAANAASSAPGAPSQTAKADATPIIPHFSGGGLAGLASTFSPGNVNHTVATQAPSAYQGVVNAIGQTAPTANNVAAAGQNVGSVVSGKKKLW